MAYAGEHLFSDAVHFIVLRFRFNDLSPLKPLRKLSLLLHTNQSDLCGQYQNIRKTIQFYFNLFLLNKKIIEIQMEWIKDNKYQMNINLNEGKKKIRLDNFKKHDVHPS